MTSGVGSGARPRGSRHADTRSARALDTLSARVVGGRQEVSPRPLGDPVATGCTRPVGIEVAVGADRVRLGLVTAAS